MSEDLPLVNEAPLDEEPPPRKKSFLIPILVITLILGGSLIWAVAMLWPSWGEYATREGNFGVELPGQPVSHQRETDVNGLGKLQFHIMELEYGDLFAAAYADVPAGIEFQPEQLLTQINMVNLGGIFTTKYQTAPRGKTGHRKYPGKDYVMSVPNQGTIVARVLLVKRRIYLLLVCGEDVHFERDDVQRFLTSFDFLEDPK